MITAAEIRNKKFDRAGRGYKIDEVESFLGEVATEFDKLVKDSQDSENKILKLVDRINEYREDEDAIKNALLNAQKQGMKIVVQAEQEAKQIVDNATIQSQKQVIATREEYNEEIDKLSKLKKDVSEFKSNLTELYNRQLRLIMEIPDEDEDNVTSEEIENYSEEQTLENNEFTSDSSINEADENVAEEASQSDSVDENNEATFSYSDIKAQTPLDYSKGYYNSQDSRFNDLKFGNNQNK